MILSILQFISVRLRDSILGVSPLGSLLKTVNPNFSKVLYRPHLTEQGFGGTKGQCGYGNDFLWGYHHNMQKIGVLRLGSGP